MSNSAQVLQSERVVRVVYEVAKPSLSLNDALPSPRRCISVLDSDYFAFCLTLLSLHLVQKHPEPWMLSGHQCVDSAVPRFDCIVRGSIAVIKVHEAAPHRRREKRWLRLAGVVHVTYTQSNAVLYIVVLRHVS